MKKPDLTRRMLSIDNAESNYTSKLQQQYPMTPSGGENKNGGQIPIGSEKYRKQMKTLPNRKPLYVEMAARVQDQENKGLEEKKKRLEEIRAFH